MSEETLILDLLKEIRSEQIEIKRKQEEFQQEIKSEQKELFDSMNKHETRSRYYEEMIKQFSNAFPKNDMEGHCRYHQGVIDYIELRNKLFKDCIYTMSKGAVISSVLALIFLGWQLIKIQAQK